MKMGLLNMYIASGSRHLGVPHQGFEHEGINSLLQQMSRKTIPEHMYPHLTSGRVFNNSSLWLFSSVLRTNSIDISWFWSMSSASPKKALHRWAVSGVRGTLQTFSSGCHHHLFRLLIKATQSLRSFGTSRKKRFGYLKRNFGYLTGVYFNKEGKMYRIIYNFAWMDFSDQNVLAVRKK